MATSPIVDAGTGSVLPVDMPVRAAAEVSARSPRPVEAALGASVAAVDVATIPIVNEETGKLLDPAPGLELDLATGQPLQPPLGQSILAGDPKPEKGMTEAPELCRSGSTGLVPCVPRW